MAMTISVVSSGRPIVAGQTANFIATVANGGSTAVVVQALQPVLRPNSGSVNIPPISFPVGFSASVPGTSSISFPFQITFNAPALSIGTLNPPAASSQYLLSVYGQFDDATTASSPMVSVSPSQAINTPLGADAANGSLRFDAGIDSGFIPLAGI